MEPAKVRERLVTILKDIFQRNRARMPEDDDDSIRRRLAERVGDPELRRVIMEEVFVRLGENEPNLKIPTDDWDELDTINQILNFLKLQNAAVRGLGPSPRGIGSSSTPLESAKVRERLVTILKDIFQRNHAQMPEDDDDSIRQGLADAGLETDLIVVIMDEVFVRLGENEPNLKIPPDKWKELDTINEILSFLESRSGFVVRSAATSRAAGRSLAASTEVSDALEPELPGSLGAFLHEYGLDWILGNWQGQDNACQMSIRLHPSGTSAEIFWKSTFGETAGVITAGKPTRPKKPKTRRKMERMLASGDLVTESGKQQTYRLVVEFAFDAQGTQIKSRRLWIRPKSKAGLPEYTLAFFPDGPNNGPTLIRYSDSREEILCSGMQRRAEA